MRDGMLDHARTAVDRAAGILAATRVRLIDTKPLPSRDDRLAAEAALRGLQAMHEHLEHLCDQLCEADADALPIRWKHFFTQYDAFLAAVRDVKSRLGTR
jgi:hypothetical protein